MTQNIAATMCLFMKAEIVCTIPQAPVLNELVSVDCCVHMLDKILSVTLEAQLSCDGRVRNPARVVSTGEGSSHVQRIEQLETAEYEI